MSEHTRKQYLTWKNWDANSFGNYTKWHASFFRSEIKKTGLTKVEDVLEVGFGNGEFISFSEASGFSTVGVEICFELVETARDRGYEAYTHLDEVPNNRLFDLIILFDVLEHIEQPEIPNLLNKLKKTLKPGGTILARFPNGDSPFGRPHQHGDITHKTTIGSGKIRYFADTAGLDVKYCGSPSMPITGSPLKYAIYNSLARPLRWVLDKSIGALYFQRTDLTFSPNLTVILTRR